MNITKNSGFKSEIGKYNSIIYGWSCLDLFELSNF